MHSTSSHSVERGKWGKLSVVVYLAVDTDELERIVRDSTSGYARLLATVTRYTNRKTFNLINPRVLLVTRFDRPQRPPHRTVAFKPGAKRDLPCAVALHHPPLSLSVCQLIPERAARRVPEAVQCHPRRLHVPLRQSQVLLQLVEHATSAGVGAEVVEGKLEVGDVGAKGFQAEKAAGEEGGEEEELLGDGEDEGAECGDVGLEGFAGDGGEVFGEGDADAASGVFFLENTAVGVVVGAFVGADGVEELVFREAAVGAAVREEDGGAADAEEAVGEEHGAGVAEVPVEGDVFCADDEAVGVRLRLRAHSEAYVKQEFAQALIGPILRDACRDRGDEAGAAAHAAEIVAENVASEFVVIDDHGGERRVGLKRLQLTIRMPMSLASPPSSPAARRWHRTSRLRFLLASAMHGFAESGRSIPAGQFDE
ncbi:hypothetical protein KSP40_PGU018190 [Platanthera guangdongensis]|uniref:Uncharacterized protein n=1 Tax=Platanthera guangdongensis TaxID=2320717 RepID=A0ABR2MEB8_9ASPA